MAMEDKMTFSDLTKRISPTLKRIIYKLSRRAAFFDHDDLYQEAMIHLLNEFRRGALNDKTDSYILQGCFFHLKNYLRTTLDKAKFVSLDAPCGDEDEDCFVDLFSIEDSASTVDSVHSKLLIEAINNNGLTTKEKAVFNFTLEGLTTREIGSKLGISHVRVVKIMSCARKKCLMHLDLNK
jgi:RNA polymerase sigma factor (sigma-70 family)